MGQISVKPPSGFRDFLLTSCSIRSQVAEEIASIYRLYGFQQIITPACENLSTLLGKGGGSDNEKLIFKIMRRGEALQKQFQQLAKLDTPELSELDRLADLGLRFDLTLPLARYVQHQKNNLPHPFKVFQLGPVWRAERPQRGRYRELWQCDVDIIGSSSIGAELECLLAIIAVLEHFELSNLSIELNDRRLLDAIRDRLAIEAGHWSDVLISLDKLDKIGKEGVLAELTTKLEDSQIEKLETIFFTSAAQDINTWRDFAPNIVDNLSYLQQELTQNVAANVGTIKFSPTLVRGQDYYTGTIFEIRDQSLGLSIAGGGRYDQLLQVFGAAETPAFGGSIGFERLALLLEEKYKEAPAPRFTKLPQVFFPLFGEGLRSDVLALAKQVRQRGLRTDVALEATKLKKQLRYAADLGIPYVAIVGETEKAQGKIKLKDMQKGSETEFLYADFIEELVQKCQIS